MKKKRVDWHGILQDLFDEALDALSGFEIVKQGREKRSYFQVDYVCELDPEHRYEGPIGGVRPLAHLKQFNLFEFKLFGDTLDENLFCYYCGRALMRAHRNRDGARSENTLTILTVHKPVSLLANRRFGFTRGEPWQYRSNWIDGLEITVIPLIELRGRAGGEAMAYLQAIEADPAHRKTVWPELLGRELAGKELIKKIIMGIDEEAFMSILEEVKTEGLIEGKRSTLTRMLEFTTQAIRARFEAQVVAADNLERLEELETQILRAISS